MYMMRFTAVLMIGGLLTGCYTLQPATGITPEIGDELAFDINDVGRVALGGAMGPEIAQIEGRLISRENADFLIGVTSIHTLRSGDQVWKGEQVRIKSEYVGSIYERHFSRARTITLGAVGAAAFAVIVTRSLAGSGSAADAGPTPPVGSSLRVP
ncbi:hypothetical protein BH11GEM1_BH11GEM1_11770 [soil metagenome]